MDGLLLIKPSTRVLLHGVSGRILGSVGERTFMLLGITDLPRRFHQVLLVDVVPVRAFTWYHEVTFVCIGEGLPLVSDGEHSSLRDDVAKIGTVETIG